MSDPLAPKQFCELHRSLCETVVPFRRKFIGEEYPDEIILVCPACVRELRKAGLTRPSKWVGQECQEVVAPPPCDHRAGRFVVTLIPLQVIYLRALGFKLHKEEKATSSLLRSTQEVCK